MKRYTPEIYEQNKEYYLSRNRIYRKTDEGKKSVLKGVYKNRQKYPEKYKARIAVSNAIATGKIKSSKEFICSICKIEQAKEYHHWHGYELEHRLDVIPVCIKCHRAIKD